MKRNGITKAHRTEYTAWKNMRARCRNTKIQHWKHYGGKGVTVDPQFASFENFFAYMGPCPQGFSIDRIDNNGNYAPGNIRWASKKTQMRNRSDNRLIEYEGKTQTLAAWAEEKGLKLATLWRRLHVGMELGEALSTPVLTSSEASRLGHLERWKK